MRVVCVSDMHGRHRDLAVPEGDLLLCAGDISLRGEESVVRDFDRWMGEQPHRHKIVIAGNHDLCFERGPAARRWLMHTRYLQDELAVVEGLRVWGSPWQPWFLDWAFNLARGEALREKWDMIPDGTDILLTHGPPFGVLDRTVRGESVGCEELLAAVRRVRPRLHVFGHIHEGYGVSEAEGTLFVNASSCDVRYRAVQAPVVVDLP
mgnify:CR=1 FL=1